jgi:hypothetical protein
MDSHEEVQCQNQSNQQNIPNNASTISLASDEEMRHASSLSNDSGSSGEW